MFLDRKNFFFRKTKILEKKKKKTKYRKKQTKSKQESDFSEKNFKKTPN